MTKMYCSNYGIATFFRRFLKKTEIKICYIYIFKSFFTIIHNLVIFYV